MSKDPNQILSTPAPVSQDAELLEKQKLLLDLQYERESAAWAEVTEVKNIAKAQRKQSAENLENARRMKERDQELCPHRKDNGKTSIGGQRLHTGPNKDHMYTFICAFCNKEFTEYTIPPMLRPPSEFVGGPDV